MPAYPFPVTYSARHVLYRTWSWWPVRWRASPWIRWLWLQWTITDGKRLAASRFQWLMHWKFRHGWFCEVRVPVARVL